MTACRCGVIEVKLPLKLSLNLHVSHALPIAITPLYIAQSWICVTMGTESPAKYKISPESIYSIDSTVINWVHKWSIYILPQLYSFKTFIRFQLNSHTIRQYRLVFILFYILASVGGLHGMQLVYWLSYEEQKMKQNFCHMRLTLFPSWSRKQV